VLSVVVSGRRRIEEAWVRTYHETGRLIAAHLLLNKDRADYGAEVFTRLAEETQISKRTLHECVQFYRCFPIVRPGAQLSWAQYRLLCQVENPELRTALVAEVSRRDFTKAALESRVRALNATLAAPVEEASPAPSASAPVKLLRPRRGTPGVFRVVARASGPAVDIGFKFYLPLSAAGQRTFSPGTFVRSTDETWAAAPDATVADLFTFRASVQRVIDGDTLVVTLALPPGEMDEKLRLRGLDCPEIDTPEGKAAKRFVDVQLLDATEVIIATAKVDKYDRYLADVFIRGRDGEEIFLNNALLKNGHAVPMGNEAMDEWVP
jgi:endonuclease YncB( thermonuclease family)